MSGDVEPTAVVPERTEPRPLRLLGADAVVCEGDSCFVAPPETAQS